MMNVYRSGDYEKATHEAVRFLELAKAEKNDFYLSKTYYLLGYLSKSSEDFGDAVIYYLEGARFAELSNDKRLKSDLISIYKNLGTIMGDYGHYELSHRFIDKGIEESQKINAENQIKSLLNNRIHELIEEERFSDAIDEISKLVEKYEIAEDRFLQLQNKAGVAHYALGNHNEAKKYFDYVVQFDKNINAKIQARALHNYGNIFYFERNHQTAYEYYQKESALAVALGHNDIHFQALEASGNALREMNQLDKAIDHYNHAISLIGDGNLAPDTYTVYKEAAITYELMGEYELALQHEQLYTENLEAFIEKQKEIEQLDKKYNIQLLTERYFDLLAANESKKQTERIATISVSSTVCMLLLVILMILYRQRKTRMSIQNSLLEIERLSEV